jgi:hypothetical protein
MPGQKIRHPAEVKSGCTSAGSRRRDFKTGFENAVDWLYRGGNT